jgi:4-methylaminobutanoate oxidase (formaldehyde-forming)
MEQALAACRRLEKAGIKQMINGPESFTPDGNFILGEAPELKNFYVGAGFNAFGIASGGGAGRALAEWVAEGEAPMDLWPVDIRRFGQVHRDRNWVITRTLEAYAHHYSMAWPHEELVSARPGAHLAALWPAEGAGRGVRLEARLGAAELVRAQGVEQNDIYTYGRQNWFPYVGGEHRACREKVGADRPDLVRQVPDGRQGCRGGLSWICSNDVAVKPGRLVYTQMLNERGGIECDLTVSRLDDDTYYIVTGTGFATHDFQLDPPSHPRWARCAADRRHSRRMACSA